MATPEARRAPRHWMGWRWRERIFQGTLILVLLVLGFVFLFPYYYMVLSSFREPFYNFNSTQLDLWPKVTSFAGYRAILDKELRLGGVYTSTVTLLLRGVRNTLFQEVTILLGSTVTSLLTAFAFSKHEFHGRNLLFYMLMSGMIIPGEVTLVPKYVMFTQWGLIKTHWALIIPAVLGAGGWFLMRMFMSAVPNAYVDAARIDGASEFRIAWDVMAPLCMPVILTNGMFGFLGIWNDLMGPLMYVNSAGKYTLQMAIYAIQSQYAFNYGWGDTTGLRIQTLFAGLVMSSIPTVLVFLVFQRYITEGTVITGLKI